MATDIPRNDPPPDSLLLRALKGDVEAYRCARARIARDAFNDRYNWAAAVCRDTTPPGPATPAPVDMRPPTPRAIDLDSFREFIRKNRQAVRDELADIIVDIIQEWESREE